MANLIKDERVVIKRGDKLLFRLVQEQEYEDISVRDNLLEKWNKDLKDKQEWLDKYEEHLKLSKEELEKQLSYAKKKIEKDIEDLKKGIEIWTDIKEESYEDSKTLQI